MSSKGKERKGRGWYKNRSSSSVICYKMYKDMRNDLEKMRKSKEGWGYFLGDSHYNKLVC